MSVEFLEAVATLAVTLGAFLGGGVVGASIALRRVIAGEVTKAVREAVEPIRRDVERLDDDVRELRAAPAR